MQVHITFEGKKSIQEVQKEFKDQLSPEQILKTTAFALNDRYPSSGYKQLEPKSEF